MGEEMKIEMEDGNGITRTCGDEYQSNYQKDKNVKGTKRVKKNLNVQIPDSDEDED